MNQLEKKTFKDLDQMLSEIADKFFFAKKMQGKDSLDDFNDYIYKVQTAYETLNDNERNLINNEFFYQSYQEWWKPLYSKASFYRYKKEAMAKFLGAFYGL